MKIFCSIPCVPFASPPADFHRCIFFYLTINMRKKKLNVHVTWDSHSCLFTPPRLLRWPTFPPYLISGCWALNREYDPLRNYCPGAPKGEKRLPPLVSIRRCINVEAETQPERERERECERDGHSETERDRETRTSPNRPVHWSIYL